MGLRMGPYGLGMVRECASVQALSRGAAKAATAQVGCFEHRRIEQAGLLIEPILENLLDGAIGRRTEVEGAAAGG